MSFFKNLGQNTGLPNFFERMPRFGAVLRQYRTLHGVSIDELAAEVEVAPSALREMEEGVRPAPSEKRTRAIGKALQLDAEEMEALTDAAEMDTPMMAALAGRAPVAATPALSAAIFVFMIADIRGYSHFTQRYGDKAAARLAMRFAEHSRAAMERWGGRLVEVRGDEALGVFASAQQALRAAHDLHARYAEATRENPEWPDGVGVGLDVGEAEQVDGGYRGAALNRAARLCALAGPGETLVTTGVAYISPMVDGVTFIARGQEQLRGIDGAVPILLAAASDISGVQAAVDAAPTTGETGETGEAGEAGPALAPSPPESGE